MVALLPAQFNTLREAPRHTFCILAAAPLRPRRPGVFVSRWPAYLLPGAVPVGAACRLCRFLLGHFLLSRFRSRSAPGSEVPL